LNQRLRGGKKRKNRNLSLTNEKRTGKGRSLWQVHQKGDYGVETKGKKRCIQEEETSVNRASSRRPKSLWRRRRRGHGRKCKSSWKNFDGKYSPKGQEEHEPDVA